MFDMSQELMSTKEVARYLKIHEKQVYALIKDGRIPASRVTGKWLFPKRLVDDWIEKDSLRDLHRPKTRTAPLATSLMAAGSNDPALEMLINLLHFSHPDFLIFTANTGSLTGLKALGQGRVDLAWIHLFDPIAGRYNTPAVISPYLPERDWVLVGLFTREVGLLVKKGNPLQIGSLDDVFSRKISIVNRQGGSGIRILLDHHLLAADVTPEELPGYNHEVSTHMDVGLTILNGEADVGIASAAVAKLLSLDFLPLTEENFDMILYKDTFFTRGIQTLIEGMQLADFQRRVAQLGGYDFTKAGRINYTTF